MVDVRSGAFRPRLAFSTLAFPGRRLAEVVELGRRLGYDGIELRLVDGELIEPTMSHEARRQVRHDLAGMAVVAVDSSVQLTGEEPGPAIDAFLRLASEWEAPAIRVFGGPLPDEPAERREALRRAAAVLEGAAPAAERLGVAIGLETHDHFSASATVAEVLDLVPAPMIGAVWDSHHPYRMGESPAEIYRNLGSRLVLAQVKDARRSSTEPSGWQLVLLGEGEVPVREMLSVLAGHGYPGAVSVEWEKYWHPEIEAPELALPQHLELLRRWLATISGEDEGPGEDEGYGEDQDEEEDR